VDTGNCARQRAARLWKAGEIPNPTFERNSLGSEWAAQRSWVYKKTFVVDETPVNDKHVYVSKDWIFEAHIFLMVRVGDAPPMFIPATFEVSDKLHYDGENLLARGSRTRATRATANRANSLVRTHKTRKNLLVGIL
jgi:beta-mannosidase